MNFILSTIGFALLVGALVLTIIKKANASKRTRVIMAAAGALLMLLSASFTIVPTGYTGVKTTFGQIDNTTLQNGFNAKIPFVQSITLVNNKQQDISFHNTVWSESKEQTVVFMENVTVTYQIATDKSAWIFANVANYTDNLLGEDLIASALKTATKKLATIDVTNRGKIEPLAKTEIQTALNEKYGTSTVNVLKVVINNMDFEDSYNEAIAQRQIAQQNYEIAQIENQTAIEKAEAQAEAVRLTAQGEADAAIIVAEGKAESNRVVAASITDNTIKQDYIEKWNGELPKVTSESGLIMDVSDIAN